MKDFQFPQTLTIIPNPLSWTVASQVSFPIFYLFLPHYLSLPHYCPFSHCFPSLSLTLFNPSFSIALHYYSFNIMSTLKIHDFHICRFGIRGGTDPEIQARFVGKSVQSYPIHRSWTEKDIPRLQGRMSHGSCQRGYLQVHLFAVFSTRRWVHFKRGSILFLDSSHPRGMWITNVQSSSQNWTRNFPNCFERFYSSWLRFYISYHITGQENCLFLTYPSLLKFLEEVAKNRLKIKLIKVQCNFTFICIKYWIKNYLCNTS